jgi:prepilin-type N-terminal cleavage/methylation domain-containing protein
MKQGFTLVELLVVIAIIGILAGLTLGVGGPMLERASRSRAAAEIAALDTALERFKVDQGDYPNATAAKSGGDYSAATEDYIGEPASITPAQDGNSGHVTGGSASQNGGRFLFACLMGRAHLNDGKERQAYIQYYEPKASQLKSDADGDYFKDPYGNAYGYYFDAASETGSDDQKSLYNLVEPDIWSTGGSSEVDATSSTPMAKWITNWAGQD